MRWQLNGVFSKDSRDFFRGYFVLFCFVFVFCCILSTAKNRLVPAECFPAESATYYAAGPGILPGLKSIPIVML